MGNSCFDAKHALMKSPSRKVEEIVNCEDGPEILLII